MHASAVRFAAPHLSAWCAWSDLPAALPPPTGLNEAGRPQLAWQPPKYVNASSRFRGFYKNAQGPEQTLFV